MKNFRELYSSLGLGITAVLIVVFSSGCTSVNKIAEYDFEGKEMAVTAPMAPRPEIYTEMPGEPVTDEKKQKGALGVLAAIAEVATDVAQAFTERDAQARLDSASAIVDVSALIADGMQDETARYLGMTGTDDLSAADFVLEVHIDRHGIFTGGSFDGRLTYLLDGTAELLDNTNGEIVWRRKVKERIPFTGGSDSRILSNIGNTVALSNLTVDQLAAVLEQLSSDAARSLTRNLSRDIRKARD